MSITLDLPEGLVGELTEEARRQGLPLGEYVARLLATGRASGPLPTTGAELVAYWKEHGVVGSRPEISDSVGHACTVCSQATQRFRD